MVQKGHKEEVRLGCTGRWGWNSWVSKQRVFAESLPPAFMRHVCVCNSVLGHAWPSLYSSTLKNAQAWASGRSAKLHTTYLVLWIAVQRIGMMHVWLILTAIAVCFCRSCMHTQRLLETMAAGHRYKPVNVPLGLNMVPSTLTTLWRSEP